MLGSSLTPSSRSDTSPEDLVLRVCGSTRHGQVVRLRSAKCTLGSGSRCTLRLRARGVGSLHCLILRGSGRTVVRRWSPDTRLNGRAFADAELAPGDRLGVGPVELEVIELGRLLEAIPTPPGKTESGEIPGPPLSAPQLPATESANNRRLDQLTARLEQQHRQGQAKRAGLEKSPGEQPPPWDADLAEVETQREELQRRRNRWNAERAELERQLSERAAEVEARFSELEAQREAFEEERLRRDPRRLERESQTAERIALEKRLDEPTGQIAGLRSELEAQRAAFEEERRQWQTERTESEQPAKPQVEEPAALAKEPAPEPEDLEPRRQQGDTEQATIESEQIDPAADSQTPQELHFEEISEQAPVELSELFGQMGSVASSGNDDRQWEEQQSEEGEDAQLWAATGPAGRPGTGQPPPFPLPTDEEEEESIDAYMSRLMDRVRATTGVSRRESYQPPRSQPEEPPQPVPRAEQPPAAKQAAPQQPKPTKMTRRAVAPEKQADLSAMRELANLSAKTAIHRYAQFQRTFARRAQLLIASVGLIVGGLLLWTWWAKGTSPLTLCAAMVGFIVFLFWVVRYARLTDRAVAGETGKADGHAQAPPQKDEGEESGAKKQNRSPGPEKTD